MIREFHENPDNVSFMKKIADFTWFVIVALIAVLITGKAVAELPPEVYEELQGKASEAVVIRVEKVISERLGTLDFSGDRKQTVSAKVVSVTRTDSGLKAGDAIVIRYVSKKLAKGMAGPSPIPRLGEGREYPAWLSKSAEGHFVPAARGYSFSEVR